VASERTGGNGIAKPTPKPPLERAVQQKFTKVKISLEQRIVQALELSISLEQRIVQALELSSPEEGAYRLNWNGTDVARFRLRRSPECSGIGIPWAVKVAPAFQGRGIGQILERMRIDALRAAGFGMALMTTRADNEVQNHIASKVGWEKTARFYNRFTKHDVIVWIMPLGRKKSA